MRVVACGQRTEVCVPGPLSRSTDPLTSPWGIGTGTQLVSLDNGGAGEPGERSDEREGTRELCACIARNRPYGGEFWQADVAGKLGLSHTLLTEGRPKGKRSNANENN